jgi:hypothetical protein
MFIEFSNGRGLYWNGPQWIPYYRSTRPSAHPAAPHRFSWSTRHGNRPDKRIVGIKASRSTSAIFPATGLPKRYPDDSGDGRAGRRHPHSLKPENREKLIYFMGIDRVRYRHPVRPGDVVEVEARVRRLRSRMGQLDGVARVNGRIVIDGTMTFALGPAPAGRKDT